MTTAAGSAARGRPPASAGMACGGTSVMVRGLPLAAAFALLLAVGAGPALADLDVREVRLGNGMRLLLAPRPQSPTVSCGWVVRAGSAAEAPGASGAAHLLEHLMFKGTRTIGTRDFRRESRLLRELERLPADAPGRERLEAELAALVTSDELDVIYAAHGAPDTNAFTSYDLTAFVVTVPASALELWFWLEADRLRQPVFRDFSTEREVVVEERRLDESSDPAATHLEAFDALFWGPGPYQHPILGWPAELAALEPADVERYFATHYVPANVTAVLVGGFDPDLALRLARTYLEPVPARPGPPPARVELQPQLHLRRVEAVADTTPQVLLRWRTPPFAHPDAPVVDLISGLLDGRSGRLYAALVDERGIGTGEPYAVHQPMRWAGMLELGAEVAEGADPAEVEALMRAEVERLRREPVAAEELERVRTRTVADLYRGLRSDDDLLFELLADDALGDHRHVLTAAERLAAVTADDVARVARAHLGGAGLNALWFLRPDSPDPSAPDAAGEP